ncbi:MAG: HAD family hydrolase [Patescibacteria group bacterium]
MSHLHHLLASDFDGTIAFTSTPSPNGITVEGACQSVILNMFGDNGITAYDLSGGLQSREPGELINIILETARNNNLNLGNEDVDTPTLIDELIRQKLAIILPEISEDWPLLAPGFREFAPQIRDLGIKLGILTSGHDEFINTFFEIHNLPTPEIVISSDTLRANGVPERYKPDPYSLEAALRQFQILHGESPRSVLYIGDSAEKDGELARRAGIPFGLINPRARFDVSLDHAIKIFEFQDFYLLGRLFSDQEQAFRSSEGFRSLFLPSDNQLEGTFYAKEKE